METSKICGKSSPEKGNFGHFLGSQTAHVAPKGGDKAKKAAKRQGSPARITDKEKATLEAVSAMVGKSSSLQASARDLLKGKLPRAPEFPLSNASYVKRAEVLRQAALSGKPAELRAAVKAITGVNTYARMLRTYGQLLVKWRESM